MTGWRLWVLATVLLVTAGAATWMVMERLAGAPAGEATAPAAAVAPAVAPAAPPEPPPPSAPPSAPPEVPKTPADAPDQPGWKARPRPEDYGLALREMMVAGRSTAALGRPEGTGDVRRLDPFALAALRLGDTTKTKGLEHTTLLKIATLLRENRIVAFGRPIVLEYPRNPRDPATWETAARSFIGIPVPPGTKLPKPLESIEFPGGDVVASPPVKDAAEDWTGWPLLVQKAREAGREPGVPLLFRHWGWSETDQNLEIAVERMLPLKPAKPQPAGKAPGTPQPPSKPAAP